MSKRVIDVLQTRNIAEDKTEPQPMSIDQLISFVQVMRQRGNAEDFIAIYADEEVTYGTLVEILDIGARNGLKMVLATKPAPSSALPK